ncbi:MAG: hypothetical protein SFY67_15375 [Candidatus Melainabacteria bacterium]|nr:hypothetical protein [Candidatus Melainabacteria bacterium]
MISQSIRISFSLSICLLCVSQAYCASPQNAEHLPFVTLNKVTMIPFNDAKSGISFLYPNDWKEAKALEADDIVKIEGQLDGNRNGEIKLALFKSNEGKITPQFAKSAVHQFLFPKLSEFKSLQEKRVAIGSSRRITAELEDVEFVMAGIKVRQRYIYFSTASGTYHFVFTSPAAHFDALVPLYNNVLLSLQISSSGTSKQRCSSSPSQVKPALVEKRFDHAQLPFSFNYPGTWKVEPTGNHDEVAKVQGQGPKGEIAYIVVHQGEVHPDWTLDQITEAMEKEFFEPQPSYRRLSKQSQNFGSMSKINGVVEEHTFDMNGAPVKQMVVIFTHNGKAYAVSQVTVGWKDGDTRQLFAKTLAGIKIRD